MPSFGRLLGVVCVEQLVEIFNAFFEVEDFVEMLLDEVDEGFELFSGVRASMLNVYFRDEYLKILWDLEYALLVYSTVSYPCDDG